MNILVKRLRAYLIDLIIVIFLLSMVALVYHPDISSYQNKLNELQSNYLIGEIDFMSYIHENSKIMKIIDEKSVILNFLNLLILIIYFVIVPYFSNGFTIGKKFNNIRIKGIKKKKLTLKKLIVRAMIINGLFYFIGVIICSMIITSNYYFYVISGISFIQIIVIIVSIFLMIKRKDKRGLHDVLSKTYVK